jgi:hypothetical protein
MKEMGKEPDPEKMPLGFEDIDEENQIAYSIYTSLGNRIYGEVGFIGKDYTNLPILIEVYEIEDKLYLLEKLSIMDDFFVDKSQKQIKKMHDDAKRKR